MAIKLAGTTVISNARAIENMTDIEGNYGQFHGTPVTISTVLDMNNPVMRRTLTAATTFTISNMATGRCALLLLDVSTSGYLPTWPANIKWPGDGTEPDWDATGQRLWLVGLTCWDNTTVRATATGWGGTGVPTGAEFPNGPYTGYVGSGTQGGDCYIIVKVKSNGIIQFEGSGTQGFLSPGNLAGGKTWLLSGAAADYEVKYDYVTTLVGGSIETGSESNGTWVSCSSDKFWGIEDSSTSSTDNTMNGTLSIRDAATQTVIDTVQVNMTADHEP
tara:strand:- start:1324 stop:2148 length:825 start_codon:yes stop_codon:yes gene_type:complete